MKHRELILQSSVYTIAFYLAQPLALVGALIVRGRIGPYLSGVLGSVTLIAFYGTFLHLGLLVAAERDLPVSRGAGDLERFKRIKDTAFTATAGSAVLFAICLITWAAWRRDQISPDLFQGLIAAGILVVGQQVTAYFVTLLRTDQRYIFLAKARLLITTATTVLSVAAVLLFGFRGVLVIVASMTLMEALYVSREAERPIRLGWDTGEAKVLLRLGLSLLVVGVATIGLRTVDNIVVLRLLGIESLGLYSIALMANNTVSSIMNALSVTWFARMGEALGSEGSSAAVRPYLVRPSLIVALLLAGLCGTLYISIPPLVDSYLPQFSGGIPAFKIVVMGTFFFGMSQLPVSILVALRRQRSILKVMVPSLAVAVGGSVLSVRAGGGLASVALWTVTGYVVYFVGMFLSAAREWMAPKEAARLVTELAVPAGYAILLVVGIDLLDGRLLRGAPAPISIVAGLVAFTTLYLPLFAAYEGKTRFSAEILKPGFAAIKMTIGSRRSAG